MDKKELSNYCQLAFVNGISDAISVIMLHKVFVVLMTGNIIYSITALATGFKFTDLVRLTLMLNFIISGIIVHNIIIKKSVHFRILLAITFMLVYLCIGVTAKKNGLLEDDSIWFLVVANVATTMSVIMNNIFYKFNATKYNLVAYTMNVLNLSHMLGEKKFAEASGLGLTMLSFVLGLIIASFITIHYDFYTILLALPILINLFFSNKMVII